MTRDEFEDWLESNKDEALDNCAQFDVPLTRWILRLYAVLKEVAETVEEPDEDEDDDDVDEEELEEDNGDTE